jgi:septal ring factor EnvC (AmiA/AmiB activator)
VSLFGAVTEVGERVTELARQHQTLNVRASEMRHNLSGMQREFDTTSNDVCRILEHLIDADHRAERIEADLAEVKTLLTKLAGQAG